MVKVSIIIPIYNTENYLRQCLDSVMKQTLNEIEIICVNDGSTDNSAEILEGYAKRDNRIRIIHKENGGLVSARKAGVNAANGKYIGYVDSDDWIEPEMYMELYSIAEKYGSDLVTSGYLLEGNYTTIHMDSVEEGIYENEKYCKLLNETIYRLDKKETGLRASLCCKLFLKDKFVNIQNSVPEQLTISEDKMCLLAYVLECNSIYVYKNAFYHYRINGASMVHTQNTKYLLALNEVYQFILSLYNHPRFSKEMRTQAEIYIIELLFKGMNTFLGFQNRNLLWIDPYWLDKLPQNSKIVLYGAGELGQKYRKHLNRRKDCQYVACVDANHEKATAEFPVLPLEQLLELNYDYVIITIKNPAKAAEVKENLQTIISADKILWFEQPEIFWKYAEADGLL